MSTTVLTRPQIARDYPEASPIEGRMLDIFEDGPGCGTKAGYLPPQLVAEALHTAQTDDELLMRHPLIVVPQAALGSLRADMLIVTRSRLGQPLWHGHTAHAFWSNATASNSMRDGFKKTLPEND